MPPRGLCYQLLGPIGAGKSTTIDMLLGLGVPDAGSVEIFGRTPAEAISAGAVGAMLQNGGLLRELSVREFLTMLASLYPTPLDVDEAIALAGIGDAAGRRTEKLSGGQTQRVRFAAPLVSDPELLVLDEPTVGMDVEARRGFWRTMREFSGGGKTILFATHYLEEADADADRAVLMARGRVVADGPTTEIKAMVGFRIIRATLSGADVPDLERLPGVTSAERHGEVVILRCSDSDAAIRAPTTATYARYELLRTFRNKRSFLLSLGFPLVLYFLIAGPNRNEHDLAETGISAPLYFMIGLLSFGAMGAMLGTGARIPPSAGWAGIASCGSPRCRRAPTSAPRSSCPTRWRSSASSPSTPPERRSASISRPGPG